jgi:hypothetical protein
MADAAGLLAAVAAPTAPSPSHMPPSPPTKMRPALKSPEQLWAPREEQDREKEVRVTSFRVLSRQENDEMPSASGGWESRTGGQQQEEEQDLWW